MNNEELTREKTLRKLNAGLYARSVWPEDQAFYMTHSFTLDEDVSPDALKRPWTLPYRSGRTWPCLL